MAAIAGVSPLNPRCGHVWPDEEIEPLRMSIGAQGVLTPLIVWRPQAEGGAMEILNGGKRWQALQAIGWSATVPVVIVDGSEAEARSIALSSQRLQTPLHPVDEYEAFAALAAAGMDVAAIARQQGLTERHVRQRLALGRLDARARDLWRRGGMDAEEARAMAEASPEAQAEMLADANVETGFFPLSAFEIRRRVRGDRLRSDDPLARFVTLDAYAKAGGTVTQSLFDEFGLIDDPALLRRLASEACEAEAKRLCAAEGWGFWRIALPGAWPPDVRQADYTLREIEADETEREDIEHAFDAARAGDLDAAQCAALNARNQALEARIFGRSIASAERAVLGIVVSPHDVPGLFEVDRAFALSGRSEAAAPAGTAGAPQPIASAFAGGGGGDTGEEDADAADAPVRAQEEPARAATARIALIRRAASVAVGVRPDLALAILCAGALRPNAYFLREDPLAVRLAECHAPGEALLLMAETDTAATAALAARLVAAGLSRKDRMEAGEAGALMALTIARGGDWDAALAAAFDPQEWFAAAGKDAAVAAVRDCAGDAAADRANKGSKAKAIAMAVQAASDTGWLPPHLRSPVCAGTETRPRAIEPPAAEIEPVAGETGAADDFDGRLAAFIEANCIAVEADGELKSDVLFEAYAASLPAGAPRPGRTPFGQAMKRLGYASRRKASGVHYIGLSMRPQAAREAAA